MSLKKIVAVIVLFISIESNAQCAMCKAVVESGDVSMAEGVNDGIVYLMIIPYLLVAALAYALYRYMKKQKASK
ncbi:hypothetical protein [Flavicella sediminum]|uniref:hypothetical protein n=1 Tax=Flavicella sediminum TaxID=2585141 RepID=UPI001124BEDB|nr:hypothetical protein [Flavicella sediminum]